MGDIIFGLMGFLFTWWIWTEIYLSNKSKPAIPINIERSCVRCEYHKAHTTAKKGQHHACIAPLNDMVILDADPVLGLPRRRSPETQRLRYHSCYDARRDLPLACGPNGNWFKLKMETDDGDTTRT